MKKKLTVGVFLALVVVLVASIVVVGDADAAKPLRTVNATITATPDGDTGNCTISVSYEWENIGAWQVDYWFSVDDGSGFEKIYKSRDRMDLKRHSSGIKGKILPDSKFRQCDYDYRVEVQLLKKNSNPVRGAYAVDETRCTCP